MLTLAALLFYSLLVVDLGKSVASRTIDTTSPQLPLRQENIASSQAVTLQPDFAPTKNFSGVVEFHWEEYYRLNPDLASQGLSTPEDAWTHYR